MKCDALRRDPVTSAFTLIIAVWMLWYGLTLLTFPITPARQHSFQGPLAIFGLRGWGVAFVAGAVVQMVRLLLLRHYRLAVWLNFIPSAVVTVWAVGWFAGPLSTAQPTYTFVAVIALFHPYLRLLASRYYTVTYTG